MNMNFNQHTISKPTEEIPVAKVAPELKHDSNKMEIKKTCAVMGCEESKNMDSDSFYRFPDDLDLRQIWTDLTGRNNWTPNDYSYICVQHFTVDCFKCDMNNEIVLVDKAVPSLKLPNHVLEVEYIDEEKLDEDEDYEMSLENEQINGDITYNDDISTKHIPNKSDLLKTFNEVQTIQRQTKIANSKLKSSKKRFTRQKKELQRLNEIINAKKKILEDKQRKKAKILLSLQDKVLDDKGSLVMSMPVKHTDDLKNFALSIYKYSPQAYIYIRNSLRTMIPSTDVLESWIIAGHRPKNVLSSSNLVKVVAEQSETELSCKVFIG